MWFIYLGIFGFIYGNSLSSEQLTVIKLEIAFPLLLFTFCFTSADNLLVSESRKFVLVRC